MFVYGGADMKKFLCGGKSTWALILCVSLIIPMVSACKKKNNDSDGKNEKRAEYVQESDLFYSDTTMPITIDFQADTSHEVTDTGIWSTKIGNDKIYVPYSVNYRPSEEEREFMEHCDYSNDEELARFYEMSNSLRENGFMILNMQGETLAKIKSGLYDTIADLAVLSDGSLAAHYSEFLPETQEYVQKVVFMDENGVEKSTVDLAGIDDFDFFVLANGGIVLRSYFDKKLILIDENGNTTGEPEYKNDVTTVCNFDGRSYLLTQKATYTETEVKIQNFASEIDVAKGTLGEPKEIASDVPYRFYRGDKLYYDADGGLYTYDLLNGTSEKVFGAENLDIWFDTCPDLKVSPEGDIDYLRIDQIGEDQMSHLVLSLTHLHREEKNPYAGKRIVYLCSCMESSFDVRKLITAYNKRPESKARIVAYIQTADISAGFEKANATAADELLLAMKSGSGPDILLNCAEYGQFNNDDILVDMNTYMDGDTGIDRSRYFDNIFRAFEANGKLYQMPALVSVIGFNADPKVLGNVESWNISEFEKKIDSLGSETYLAMGHFMDNYYVSDAKGLLCGFLYNDMDHYVDYSKRECSFDSDDFRKLLEICKKYGDRLTPDQYSVLQEEYDNMTDDHRQESLMMQDGVCALSTMYVSNLSGFGDFADLCNNDPLFIGWPASDSSGMTAVPDVSFGISAFSDCKDEAWDFISFALSEEAQKLLVDSGNRYIYVNRAAEDADLQESIRLYNEQYRYYSEELEDPEYASHLSVINEETAQRFLSVIERIGTGLTKNPTITNIVLEESEAYFSGSQSAENVSRSIQNRITTLLQETK